jgi:DNA adenine methylase
MQPVVKWAGGKRQLLGVLELSLPSEYRRYIEPFAGGAALLFHLAPSYAVINDANDELINTYRVIKSRLAELVVELQKHENNRDYFYAIRNWDRQPEEYAHLSNVQRAARFLYLNRTCYNGLYRVNKRGQFNVPYGKYKNPSLVNEAVLQRVHDYFHAKEVYFFNTDFEQFFHNFAFERGDFVYIDPPYDPFEQGNNFVQYQGVGFGKEQQLKLKQICDTLTDRGVNFLLSNSATPYICGLYQEQYYLQRVKARRMIASQVASRVAIEEVLVCNYATPKHCHLPQKRTL